MWQTAKRLPSQAEHHVLSGHGRGTKPFSVVQDFFRRSGVATMTVRELFDFVTDPTLADDKVDEYLDEVRAWGV
jgi:hypothetical protein